MNKATDQIKVNPLIVEILASYETDVRDLAIEAIRLSNNQAMQAVVDQMAGHVRKKARERKDKE